jgi:hypothetical protein
VAVEAEARDAAVEAEARDAVEAETREVVGVAVVDLSDPLGSTSSSRAVGCSITSTTRGHETWPLVKPLLPRLRDAPADRAGWVVELAIAAEVGTRSEIRRPRYLRNRWTLASVFSGSNVDDAFGQRTTTSGGSRRNRKQPTTPTRGVSTGSLR